MNNQEQQPKFDDAEQGYIDPAGLMFQGRIVIKDADTGEIIVDKRSE
jgi:hypothetical protein